MDCRAIVFGGSAEEAGTGWADELIGQATNPENPGRDCDRLDQKGDLAFSFVARCGYQRQSRA